MFKLRYFIWALCIGFTSSSLAQNLIPNPSFERCNLCPTKLGSFKDDVIHWSAPTLGSTDYFNSCSRSMGTPENFNGEQDAQSGSAYAGFYLFAPEDYREYIQTRLDQPLKKDREYKLTFYLSRAEGSDFAVRDIGVLFVDKEMQVDTKKALTRRHWYASGIGDYNLREIKADEFWEQTSQWIKLETNIVARGTESFLIIGNFNPNRQTRVVQTIRSAKKGAYYYVDNLSLELTGEEIQAVNSVNEPLALNQSHRFENVLFEFDRFILLDSAKADIENIFRFMEQHGDLRIHIEGHTDNIGSVLYNEKLSGYRCEAVARYLEDLGLSKDRITWRAHGGSLPIADNATDEGRKLNRRVEFTLLKNEVSVNK